MENDGFKFHTFRCLESEEFSHFNDPQFEKFPKKYLKIRLFVHRFHIYFRSK